MTDIRLRDSAAHTIAADALVVGIEKGDDGPVLATGTPALDEALRETLLASLAALGASGTAGEVTRLPSSGTAQAGVVAVVGLGDVPADDGRPDTEALRRAAGAAVRALAGTRSVALALPSASVAEVRAVAEGALLGAYGFDRYRTASRNGHKPPVSDLTVLTAMAGDDAAENGLRHAEAVCSGVVLARDLVNTPPSDLHPADLAAVAVTSAEAAGVDVEVLDEESLAAGGYGGILGVGQGSVHPPRLVRLSYTHPEATKRLALVGKGITFDSGGISLKPAANMDWMKSDMGGAAAVIAAVVTIARLGLAVDVTGWVPAAENMPSGTAQRPSDVLTIYGGKTVEVLNTDAEGRLILADALVRAAEEHPDVIVDIATLTGAQLVALGARTAAIMANDDDLRAGVHEAANRAGEQMWPMPLPEELRKSLDSEVADIANMGDRYGGMMVAGLFLQEFVAEGVRWAHLDVAGPAYNQGDPYGYTPKGGTGAGVRTLVAVAADLADGVL